MNGLISKVFLCILAIFFKIYVYPQKNIDSLINISKTALNDSNKIIALQELSWTLKANNPEDAIKYGNEALDLSRTNKYELLEAKSLKCVATAHLFAGNLNKSEQYFLTAVKLFKQVNDEEGESSCYNNLGLVLEYKGDYVGATDAYKQSLKIDKRINNRSGVAASLSNIGNILLRNGDYNNALKHYIESLKIREEINDIKGIAVVYLNIGAIYEKKEAFGEAIKNYKKALSKYMSINEKRQSAIALNNIGNLFYLQHNHKKAISYYEQALDIRREVNDKKGIASTLSNIANVYIEEKKYDEALKYIDKSEEYYKSVGNEYEINRLKIARAKYYLQKKHYRKVINLLSAIYKNPKIHDEYRQELYNILSEAYFKIGNYKKAFIDKEKYASLRDSLQRSKATEKIVKLQLQYEFDKKQKELEILQEKQQLEHERQLINKKIINWLLITCLIAFVLILFFIYRSYLRKKKDNSMLLFQKRQIEIINDELIKYKERFSEKE